MSVTHKAALVAAVLTAGTLAVASTAAADPVADFYNGKKITLIVGSDAGGGYDANARLMSRHMSRFIPGNPMLVVQNMPGAGSFLAANNVYNLAPKDGTTMGLVQRTILSANVTHQNGAHFDVAKFSWIGNLANEISLFLAWHDAPVKTAQDMFTKEFIMGGGGPTSDSEVQARMLNALLGTKIKIVSGYPGQAQIQLAMERGEVQGMVGLDWDGVKSSKGDWVRDKKIRMLMQIAQTRAPDLPDVPTVLDFARTPADRQVLELFLGRQKYARPFAAPPGLPDAVVAALRDGFAKVAQDVDFIREATAAHSPINYVPGEEVDALAQRIYASPPELIQRAAQELAKANE